LYWLTLRSHVGQSGWPSISFRLAPLKWPPLIGVRPQSRGEREMGLSRRRRRRWAGSGRGAALAAIFISGCVCRLRWPAGGPWVSGSRGKQARELAERKAGAAAAAAAPTQL